MYRTPDIVYRSHRELIHHLPVSHAERRVRSNGPVKLRAGSPLANPFFLPMFFIFSFIF